MKLFEKIYKFFTYIGLMGVMLFSALGALAFLPVALVFGTFSFLAFYSYRLYERLFVIKRNQGRMLMNFNGESREGLRKVFRKTASNIGVKLSGRNFNYAIANGLDFSLSGLKKTKWIKSSCRHSSFHGADLSNSSFQLSNLKSANLKSAMLKGARFQYANLDGANLKNCNLMGANLKGANLRGVECRDVVWSDAVFDDRTVLPFSRSKALARGMQYVG